MAASAHPVATHHLPWFITAPGETDVLMVVMAWILLGSVLAVGILFFRLHTLPERFAHKHIFWIAGLLLALIDLPDFSGSLGRIAGSVEKMAGVKPGEGAADVPPDMFSEGTVNEVATEAPHETTGDVKRGDAAAQAPKRPELVPAGKRS